MKLVIAVLSSLITTISAATAIQHASSDSPEKRTRPIAILRSSAEGPNPDGSYGYSYETENGIKAGEKGELIAVPEGDSAISAQGSFSYTANDGTPIEITYIANENGFQPQGAHLPVTPKVPPAILKALEWIANHPEEDNLTRK